MITVETSGADPVSEAVLFSFDDRAIPWKDNLHLTLVQAEKHSGNPVLRTGPEGSHDSTQAFLYGSVIEVDGKFRMWYLASWAKGSDSDFWLDEKGWWRPMCYAESDDGIHWTKPDLGLVEYNGSRNNNICLIEPEGSLVARVGDFLSVMHDPDDPDPSRRYKTAYIMVASPKDVHGGIRAVVDSDFRLPLMACATSADGLTWQVVGDRPCVNEKFEVSSLYRFGDFYYAGGQQVTPWTWLPDGSDCWRVWTTYRSSDFEHWSRAKAMSFARPGQRTVPPVAGQETHMGAGLWHRGNVLVGLYGMWQDGGSEDPDVVLDGTRIDLGLVCSDDGLYFREPVPDFKVIPRGEEHEWDAIGLTQGHAFANVGDRTLIWYGHWDCENRNRSEEIGLATLRRDGFGYLSRHHESMPGHFQTCRLMSGNGHLKLFANVDGVSPETPLKIELVDALDRPIPEFSGANATELTTSGTRQLIHWPVSGSSDCSLNERFAVKVGFPPRGDARLYALYVAD